MSRLMCNTCLMEYFPTRSKSDRFCCKKCELDYKATRDDPEENTTELAAGKRETFAGKKVNYWNRRFSDYQSNKIKERDGYSCYICGKSCDTEVHHIIPRSEGGSHHAQNLITLCKQCHKVVETGNEDRSVKQCSKNAVLEVKRRIEGRLL